MKPVAKYCARGLGYSLIVVFLYSAIALSLLVYSIVVFKYGVALKNRLLNNYQKEFYFSGYRNIWQAIEECIELDDKLIYKPRLGVCHFNNPEFSTTLNFGPYGRISHLQDELKGSGIAVLGDSFAMGWGVEDDETFAAVLERKIKRPVYNLAVSSYGTYRELLRLEKSGLVDSVDTVIIQYCSNDLNENLDFKNERLETVYKQFKSARSLTGSGHTYKFVLNMSLYALIEPIRLLKNILLEKEEPLLDFAPHYDAFIKVINEFAWLKNKNVIVIYVNGPPETRFKEFPGRSNANTLPKYLKFLDIKLSSDYFFVVDGHLTKYGHEKMAGELFDSIYQNH